MSFFTYDEIKAITDLSRFSNLLNSMGERYQYVTIPSEIFSKAANLILGLGYTRGIMPEPKKEEYGPRTWIHNRTEELFAEYLKNNPIRFGPDTPEYQTELLRLKSNMLHRAEQAAIIEYLQTCYKRGILPAGG